MTSEQIAELRRVHSALSYPLQGHDCDCGWIHRILDEREALLAAVLFVLTTWDVFDGHEADVSAQQETLQRAADKAQAP